MVELQGEKQKWYISITRIRHPSENNIRKVVEVHSGEANTNNYNKKKTKLKLSQIRKNSKTGD